MRSLSERKRWILAAGRFVQLWTRILSWARGAEVEEGATADTGTQLRVSQSSKSCKVRVTQGCELPQHVTPADPPSCGFTFQHRQQKFLKLNVATHTFCMTAPNSVHASCNSAAKASGFSTLLKDVRNMLHDHAEAAKGAAPAMSNRRAAARQAAQERREQEEQIRRAAFEPKLALLLEKLQKHATQTGTPS